MLRTISPQNIKTQEKQGFGAAQAEVKDENQLFEEFSTLLDKIASKVSKEKNNHADQAITAISQAMSQVAVATRTTQPEQIISAQRSDSSNKSTEANEKFEHVKEEHSSGNNAHADTTKQSEIVRAADINKSENSPEVNEHKREGEPQSKIDASQDQQEMNKEIIREVVADEITQNKEVETSLEAKPEVLEELSDLSLMFNQEEYSSEAQKIDTNDQVLHETKTESDLNLKLEKVVQSEQVESNTEQIEIPAVQVLVAENSPQVQAPELHEKPQVASREVDVTHAEIPTLDATLITQADTPLTNNSPDSTLQISDTQLLQENLKYVSEHTQRNTTESSQKNVAEVTQKNTTFDVEQFALFHLNNNSLMGKTADQLSRHDVRSIQKFMQDNLVAQKSVNSIGATQSNGLANNQSGLNVFAEQNSKTAQVKLISKEVMKLNIPRTLERVENALKEISRSKDGKTISLRLDPPSLGSLKIDVTLKDGQMHARFIAETPQVTQILREQSHELQQILRRAGIQAEKISVSVASESMSSTAGEFTQLDGRAQEQFKEAPRKGHSGRSHIEQSTDASFAGKQEVKQMDHWVA